MRIPEEILKRWKELQAYGDITAMANGDPSKRVYLSNALTKGECGEEIFITLRDFFKKREELIETAK
jgi:hypothetical protein